jgi:Type II CAAX prenyl endopeptidase Rce1-like
MQRTLYASVEMDQTRSNRTFIGLIVLYSALAGISVFLPQDYFGAAMPAEQMPAAPVLIALANAGIVLVVYGGLGLVGLRLARKLGLPDIWDAAVPNRGRFIVPALIGIGLGIAFIIGDLLFSSINGIGRLPHPPFVTAIVASLAAAIGEETMFRLFFISFWTWLVARVLLRGRWQTPVFWVVAILSALAFAMAHLPALMFFHDWSAISQIPTMLLVEIVLLNGLLGMCAAWAFKKYGFLAPVGMHFWADIVWHVLWGLF